MQCLRIDCFLVWNRRHSQLSLMCSHEHFTWSDLQYRGKCKKLPRRAAARDTKWTDVINLFNQNHTKLKYKPSKMLSKIFTSTKSNSIDWSIVIIAVPLHKYSFNAINFTADGFLTRWLNAKHAWIWNKTETNDINRRSGDNGSGIETSRSVAIALLLYY